MRGKKAKAIRRQVYGDMSLRTPRPYDWSHRNQTGTCTNTQNSNRAKYQEAKNNARIQNS